MTYKPDKNDEPFSDLSMFLTESEANQEGDGSWTVCSDVRIKRGYVYGCIGDNEFEAKEDAYHYLKNLREVINEQRKKPKESDK